MHPNAQRVADAASALGLDVEIREFPEGTRTAVDAADAIGVDVGQIVKSLVFTVDGEPVVALVSGPNRLDEQKLARAVDGRIAERTGADVVREVTGFPVGGVPPFGHARPLPTLVDQDLLDYAEVWAAAGTPRHVFRVAPAALVEATGATPADLAEE